MNHSCNIQRVMLEVQLQYSEGCIWWLGPYLLNVDAVPALALCLGPP